MTYFLLLVSAFAFICVSSLFSFSIVNGVVQFAVNFDVKSGFNEQQTDIDYTIGK